MRRAVHWARNRPGGRRAGVSLAARAGPIRAGPASRRAGPGPDPPSTARAGPAGGENTSDFNWNARFRDVNRVKNARFRKVNGDNT